MDTRIMMDYLRRWAWLWVLVFGGTLLVGFAPKDEMGFLLAMPMIYLVIPMSTEFRKQGPMWVHRTLPVRDQVLARTGWLLAVILPIAAVALSLMPAVAFAGLSGRSNLASEGLLPLIAGGLLWTSASFVLTAFGNHDWHSKPLHLLVMGGSFLVAGALVLLMMKSAQYWGHPPIRVGLIMGAAFLAPVSYFVSPQILQAMVRNHGKESTRSAGDRQPIYAVTAWDRMMAGPFMRTLLTGVWLLSFLFWMNLFYAFLSERADWWNIHAMFAVAPVGMQMMAMFLFLYSFAHVSSLRGTAMLPISRVRRTLTVISLPLAAALPFTVCVLAQMLFTQAEPEALARMSIMLLYCLVTAYTCLALCLRFGFLAAMGGLMVFMFGVMIRILLAGQSGMPGLSVLDAAGSLILVVLVALWIHQILERHPNVYRRHWLPSGMRRA